jgi:diguanylate cyclase (GGDEF)-like protein
MNRLRSAAKPVGVGVIGAGLLVFALQLIGAGDWTWQVGLHQAAGPPLLLVASVLAYIAMRRSTAPGARRHWRLMSFAFALVAAGDVVAGIVNARRDVPEFPVFEPASQLMYLVAVILAVVAIMSIPGSVAWSANRLRIGLDMIVVILGSAVFLWYFSVGPVLEREADPVRVVSSLAQATGVLVAVFVVARVVFTGTRGVRRAALGMMGAGGVIEVIAESLLPHLDRGETHYAFAITGVFRVLLVGGPLLQLLVQADSSAPQQRPARTFSALPFAAVAATDMLLVAAFLRDVDSRTAVVLGGAIVLTGLVATRQIVALRDNANLVLTLRQAMAREQVLGELGTALLTARDSAAIHRLTVGAAERLVAALGTATTVVPDADPKRSWRIVAAAGTDAEMIVGHEVTAPSLPDELIGQLMAGTVVEIDPVALSVTTAGLKPETHSVLLLPLVAGDRFFAVLSVSAKEPVGDDVRKSLETLRTQAALALETAVLTAELTEQATHDSLTGLANRKLIRDRLDQALGRVRRDGGQVAALLLDLNGFKQINDELGHEAGDEVLRVVAQRLAACVRGAGPSNPPSTVGRLGGDEFVVLVEDLDDPAVATLVADRITTALSSPMAVGEHRLRVRASIGVALSGPAAQCPDQLLRIADAAMYESKRATRRLV